MRVVIANGTIYERLPFELASIIPGGKPWLSVKLSELSALSQLPGPEQLHQGEPEVRAIRARTSISSMLLPPVLLPRTWVRRP